MSKKKSEVVRDAKANPTVVKKSLKQQTRGTTRNTSNTKVDKRGA